MNVRDFLGRYEQFDRIGTSGKKTLRSHDDFVELLKNFEILDKITDKKFTKFINCLENLTNTSNKLSYYLQYDYGDYESSSYYSSFLNFYSGSDVLIRCNYNISRKTIEFFVSNYHSECNDYKNVNAKLGKIFDSSHYVICKFDNGISYRKR